MDISVAVVTGAGSGVGQACVVQLAQRGFTVALLGRREAQLIETIALAGAKQKPAGKLLAIACDVSVEADVQRMAERVRGHLGQIDALVAPADD